ncbi:hypothetical protein BFP70_11000 [Thioclava sp. SK-1]|uniref:periplasmic heavy metal sensor n=1 Tax=Thioclava sp. SK-1 TaxID=1889770 RepID=UPI000825A6C4|nr:periplasmic heavy metal sensor [Thioclava sp. SK-1]OCX64555.1 hypothetical protein BFP70_11000 [Thioclava sp. SK-1]
MASGSQPGDVVAVPRGVRWALIASVTVNILVLGVIVGGILGHGAGGKARPMPEMSFGPFDRGLRPEDKAAIRKAAMEKGVDLRGIDDESRQNFDTILTAIAAEPFDMVTLQDALRQHRAEISRRIELGENLMVDHLKTLSPQQRQNFVNQVRNMEHKAPPPRP